MNGISSLQRGQSSSNEREARLTSGNAATPQVRPWLKWAAALALACQASVQADARVGGTDDSGEPVKSFDRPLDVPVTPPPAEDDVVGGDYALLGARHDLAYAGPKAASCACLAVALGDQSRDPSFAWELEAPRLDPSTQWIVALSSNEVSCETPPSGTLGASYQGYATEGNDVVVYVEALAEGRPLTSGAIIPRPKPNGAVYIEPTNAVYGKPLNGKGKRCKLSAPGSKQP